MAGVLTVNRSTLDDGTDNHDDSADKDTHTSSTAITDQADKRRRDDTSEGEDCRHDTKQCTAGLTKVWELLSAKGLSQNRPGNIGDLQSSQEGTA